MKKRRSLITDMVIIVLVLNVLSVVLFSYYIKVEGNSTSINYAKESMLEIVKEKSELISIKFDRLENNTEILKIIIEEALKNEKSYYTIPEGYSINKDKSVIREKKEDVSVNSQSNVLVKLNSENADELARELVITEVLDEAMGTIIDNEDVIWGYTVTGNNLLRVSPYLNLEEFFDDNHDQTRDVFYTMAGPEKNPDKKAILTSPYNDYLGMGWTITCTQPIYDRNGDMFGVVCLDAALKTMAEELFKDFSLGSDGKIIWLDPQGNIFYHSDFEGKSEIQGEIFEKNIFTMNEMSYSEKAAYEKTLSKTSGLCTYVDKNFNSRIMVYSKVEGMDSYLLLQMDTRDVQPTIKFDFSNIWVLIVLDGAIALIFIIVLYRQFSKPVRALVNRANKISQGDYSLVETLPGDNYFEIAQLNEAFDYMSKNITLDILAEKELQQMEKMAGVGQLSAAIVHELKNVMARIKGATYVIELTGKNFKNSDEIEIINSSISEAENVITTLLDFSRKNSADNKINVGSIINQIFLLSNKEIISKGISVEIKNDEECIIYSDGIEALKIVLQNIILNAIQAIEDGGHIWINIKKDKENETIMISVMDDGPGIKIEPKERIFEPFVTTKEKGSGIGLWITRKMVESLNGTIKLNNENRFTEFIITIPVGSEDKNE